MSGSRTAPDITPRPSWDVSKAEAHVAHAKRAKNHKVMSILLDDLQPVATRSQEKRV